MFGKFVIILYLHSFIPCLKKNRSSLALLMRRVLQQGIPCTTAALWLGYFHLSMQNTTFLSFDCRVLEFLSFNYRIPHVYFLQIANELSVIIFFPSIATFVCILSGLRKIKTLQETYKKKLAVCSFAIRSCGQNLAI